MKHFSVEKCFFCGLWLWAVEARLWGGSEAVGGGKTGEGYRKSKGREKSVTIGSMTVGEGYRTRTGKNVHTPMVA